MATSLLGNKAIGYLVNMNENGSPVEFYVSKQNYESDLNGTGRTLLVRKDGYYPVRGWNSSNSNGWATSTMLSWLNDTYKTFLDSEFQNLINTTKYYYTPGAGDIDVSTRSDSIFLLSLTELGLTHNYANVEGTALSIASTLQIAYRDGIAVNQWTRSPYTKNTTTAWYLSSSGSQYNGNCINGNSPRPVFTLPSTTTVAITTISAPSLIMAGQSIPISWGPVTVSDYDTTYCLQRSINNGNWTTIYTGTQTSFTDIAETGGAWLNVQYRITPIIPGVLGGYVQSNSIPVSDPAVLVISGQDGDLGTIVTNIPYTVSTNTGNSISLTRKVNQVEVANINIDSGFAYNIPIFDLPTGTNTIQLIAQVQTPTGQVNETRTWTYTKTPMQFSDSGGVAELVQNGQNIWPLTLAEAVRVPTYFGGSLDKALELLSTTIDFNVMAVGEYIGTGTYGQNNPNTLTFTSAPLMVFVYGENNTLIISSTNTSSTAYISDTQATWYSTASAEAQMNTNGITYNYIAIGKIN